MSYDENNKYLRDGAKKTTKYTAPLDGNVYEYRSTGNRKKWLRPDNRKCGEVVSSASSCGEVVGGHRAVWPDGATIPRTVLTRRWTRLSERHRTRIRGLVWREIRYRCCHRCRCRYVGLSKRFGESGCGRAGVLFNRTDIIE